MQTEVCIAYVTEQTSDSVIKEAKNVSVFTYG